MAPSNLHGFTSVVIGLCGFGIAPCARRWRRVLVALARTSRRDPVQLHDLGRAVHVVDVERVLRVRPRTGVGRQRRRIRSPLRVALLRDGRPRSGRARDRRPTGRSMVAELRQAIAMGALGFATSRGPNHVDGYGDPVPSRFADDEELQALVEACAGRTWQVNVEAKFGDDAVALNAEVARYADWSRRAGARLTWSPFHAEFTDTVWPDVLVAQSRTQRQWRHRRATGLGVARRACCCGGTSRRSSLGSADGSLCSGTSSICRPTRASRCSLDPATRRALEAADPNARFAPRLRRMVLAASPSAPELVGLTVAEAARRRNAGAIDFLCDTVIADGSATLVQMMVANRNRIGAQALMVDPGTLLALGDAGRARDVGDQLSLSHLHVARARLRPATARARTRGRADDVGPARFYGLADRGELRVGRRRHLCHRSERTRSRCRARRARSARWRAAALPRGAGLPRRVRRRRVHDRQRHAHRRSPGRRAGVS